MRIITGVLIAGAIAFLCGPQAMSAAEFKTVSGACRCEGVTQGLCPFVYEQRECPGTYYACDMDSNGWGRCYSTQHVCKEKRVGATLVCPEYTKNEICNPIP